MPLELVKASCGSDRMNMTISIILTNARFVNELIASIVQFWKRRNNETQIKPLFNRSINRRYYVNF